jgi:chitinase
MTLFPGNRGIELNQILVDALTHLNYAFAYIDPSTFDIVTMSSDTPAQLFQTVVNAKSYKSDLQVWLSIGGWTFSDNGTATQAVFGTIAASSTNRQTFANNLLIFLNHYGFDGMGKHCAISYIANFNVGVDLDWEYPGAPDRGGSPDDTANYVSLLETIRATFDTSPRALGISFTAPSSYWYLRWFDLPSLLLYADWINLMTYDLHGVWDRNNPIGAIVQGHTNLTEIGYSLDLLW